MGDKKKQEMIPISKEVKNCAFQVGLGCLAGCAVGALSGIILGPFFGFSSGLRGADLMRSTGQMMKQNAGWFTMILGTGSIFACFKSSRGSIG
eukprot:c7429_g1_i1.p1 GENE.c7429_g1_i1~~c7429_g1_i1.p1  ORF type:complete len:106 (-),score=39.68 c7429_g1_i1:127-405(-)